MRVIRLMILALVTLMGTVASNAQNRVRGSINYNRTDFPFVEKEHDYTKNVNGATAEADVKVFGSGGLRFSLAYNAKLMRYVVVYPHYFDGTNVVDLHRDVWTHTGLAQLGFKVKGAVEPFVALGYGKRKIHVDAPRQTVRTIRFGANVPITKHLFAKGYYDLDKPYGELPMGFVNPDTQGLGIGLGFNF